MTYIMNTCMSCWTASLSEKNHLEECPECGSKAILYQDDYQINEEEPSNEDKIDKEVEEQ